MIITSNSVQHEYTIPNILIIGEVLESDILSGEEPLTYAYYREKYRMLSPKNAPTKSVLSG